MGACNLQVSDEVEAMLRASAEEHDMTLDEYVAHLRAHGHLAARLAQAHDDADRVDAARTLRRFEREG